MAGASSAQVGFELKAVDNVSKAVRNAMKQMAKLADELDRISRAADKASSAEKRFAQAQEAAAKSATRFSKAARKKEASLKGVNNGAKKSAISFSKLGKAAQKVFFIWETGTRIARALKQFLVDPFANAAKSAASFALKLEEINTLFDRGVKNSSERVAVLGKSIDELSMRYGQDLLKTGSAAYNAVSAGAVDTASAQVVLKNATQLATAGLVENDTAMKALTTVSNAFGRSLTTSAHVGDLLFTTVQKGVTTMGELAPKIGRVAGLAGAAGMDMEAMFAVIAAGTKVTGLTSVTVTGLRSAINLLLKPGKEARVVLAGVNKRLKTNKIAFGAAATEGDGMIRTLRNMAKAFHEGNLSAEELNRIIPNARAQAVVLGIVKEGANDLTKSYKLMIDKQKISGVVFEKSNAIMRTASKQLDRYKSTLAVARKELGKMFTKSGAMGSFFRGMSEGLEDVAEAFRITSDESNTLFHSQENTWEHIGSLIARVGGTIVSVLKNIVTFVMGLGNAWFEVFESMQTSVTVLMDLIFRFGKALATDLVLTVVKTFPRLGTLLGIDDHEIDPMKKSVKRQIRELNDVAVTQFKAIGKNLASAGKGLLKPFVDVVQEIGTIWGMPLLDTTITTDHKFSEPFGATGKGKKKKPPPDLPGDVKATAKKLKEMSAIFAEALAGTQTEFQKAVTRQGLSLFRDVMATGVSGAITQGTEELLSQQAELKNLKFMTGATDPLPEVPVKDLAAKAATMQQVFERMKAGDKEFKTDSQLLEFLKETQAFAGTAEEKLRDFVKLIQKISTEDIGKVVSGGLAGAQEILQKNLESVQSAEKMAEKNKARSENKKHQVAADIQKKWDKAKAKHAKAQAKLDKKNAQQRLKEVESIAQEYGAFGAQLMNQFAKDIFDSTKTIGDAFIGLFDNVLEMISNTLTEFLLAEGIKQAMLQTSADVAISTNAQKQVSDTTTAVSKVTKDMSVAQSGLVGWAAGLGPVGLILLGILTPIFIGMIRGFLSDLKSAPGKSSGGLVTNYLASGGFVRMQPKGTDTVPAMLTPGEFVLSKPMVDSIRQGRSPNSSHYASGGMVSHAASSSAAPVVVNMQTFAVPSKAQFRRWYKDTVAPNRRVMRSRGQI
jgi:TP901 family phage tail tape measure protein